MSSARRGDFQHGNQSDWGNTHTMKQSFSRRLNLLLKIRENRTMRKFREIPSHSSPVMYSVRVLGGATTLGKVNRNKRDAAHMYSYNLYYPLSTRT